MKKGKNARSKKPKRRGSKSNKKKKNLDSSPIWFTYSNSASEFFRTNFLRPRLLEIGELVYDPISKHTAVIVESVTTQVQLSITEEDGGPAIRDIRLLINAETFKAQLDAWRLEYEKEVDLYMSSLWTRPDGLYDRMSQHQIGDDVDGNIFDYMAIQWFNYRGLQT